MKTTVNSRTAPVKNSVRVTDHIVDFLYKLTLMASGLVKTNVRLTETKGGGITIATQFGVLKNALDNERKNLNKANGGKANISILQYAQIVIDKVDSSDKLMRFYYNAEGEKMMLDQSSKQKRMTALSGRIVKSFGFELPKGERLTDDQIVSILREASSAFIRITKPYAPAVKVIKKADIKTKAPSKGKGKSAPKSSVNSILAAPIVATGKQGNVRALTAKPSFEDARFTVKAFA